jgi:hypothetical protein
MTGFLTIFNVKRRTPAVKVKPAKIRRAFLLCKKKGDCREKWQACEPAGKKTDQKAGVGGRKCVAEAEVPERGRYND